MTAKKFKGVLGKGGNYELSYLENRLFADNKKLKERQYDFSEYDENTAVSIAQTLWKRVDSEKQKLIKKYIKSTLMLWKNKHGLPHAKNYEDGKNDEALPKPGLGLSGYHLRVTEEKRYEIIKNKKPWECAPDWVNSNPIDLWFHIRVNDYYKINHSVFAGGLAWLIIDCQKNKNPAFRPAMIKNALWLANINFNGLAELAQEGFNYKKGFLKRCKALNVYNTEREELSNAKDEDIRKQASYYLSSGGNKGSIVGKIAGSNKTKQREVRRALEVHESGLWKPKKKK